MVSIDELFYGTGVSGLTEIERLQKNIMILQIMLAFSKLE